MLLVRKKATFHSLIITRDTEQIMETERRGQADPSVQHFSHGQNLSSTLGQAEVVAQYFLQNLHHFPASAYHKPALWFLWLATGIVKIFLRKYKLLMINFIFPT
jgi:hypothetical protein